MKIDQLRLAGKVNLIFFTFPKLVIFILLNNKKYFLTEAFAVCEA